MKHQPLFRYVDPVRKDECIRLIKGLLLKSKDILERFKDPRIYNRMYNKYRAREFLSKYGICLDVEGVPNDTTVLVMFYGSQHPNIYFVKDLRGVDEVVITAYIHTF